MKDGGLMKAVQWTRSSGVSLQKQSQNLNTELAKQASAALEDSKTQLPLHHLCLQCRPCTPSASAHSHFSILPSLCVHLISRTKSDDCIPEAKETKAGVSQSILLRQIHTTGDHHHARVSDLVNRKNQKNSGSYRAPILDSLCQMSRQQVDVGLSIRSRKAAPNSSLNISY
jgi:hypothetical protein